MTALLTLIPEIGALRVLAAVVVGQLVVSALMDLFGLLQIPVVVLSLNRVAGFVNSRPYG